MLKNVKLGTKIIVGFGIQIVIACVVGGLAIWSMDGVRNVTEILIKENIPEVSVSNDMGRFVLDTMYEMRGYTLTEDPKFLAEGKKSLAEVAEHVKEAKAHAASSSRLAEPGRGCPKSGRRVHGLLKAPRPNGGFDRGDRKRAQTRPRPPPPGTWNDATSI